ncbi:hypothetical protein V6C27_01185 [Peptococcaceae bacterium 1198_IL3148]
MIERILLILGHSTNIDNFIALVDKLQGPSSSVTVLNIIDSGWKNILGDEWISNATTRNNFFQYMENNYYREAVKGNDAFSKWAEGKGITLNPLIKIGVPQKIVMATFTEFGPFDIVILPTGGTINLKAETLADKLGCPIIINPV